MEKILKNLCIYLIWLQIEKNLELKKKQKEKKFKNPRKTMKVICARNKTWSFLKL